jgi:hypothetical protein
MTGSSDSTGSCPRSLLTLAAIWVSASLASASRRIVGLDVADAGGAGGDQVVDALGAGDLALERRGDEALDQVGVAPK